MRVNPQFHKEHFGELGISFLTFKILIIQVAFHYVHFTSTHDPSYLLFFLSEHVIFSSTCCFSFSNSSLFLSFHCFCFPATPLLCCTWFLLFIQLHILEFSLLFHSLSLFLLYPSSLSAHSRLCITHTLPCNSPRDTSVRPSISYGTELYVSLEVV